MSFVYTYVYMYIYVGCISEINTSEMKEYWNKKQEERVRIILLL